MGLCLVGGPKGVGGCASHGGGGGAGGCSLGMQKQKEMRWEAQHGNACTQKGMHAGAWAPHGEACAQRFEDLGGRATARYEIRRMCICTGKHAHRGIRIQELVYKRAC
eukprot:1151181-Pelagomonas_calceolata.AAC.3